MNYSVGDIGPAKGIIFFDKGFMSDGWRYLEAARNDVFIETIYSKKVSLKNDGKETSNYIVEKKVRLANENEIPTKVPFGFFREDCHFNSKCCGATSAEIGAGKDNTEKLVNTMGDAAYTSQDPTPLKEQTLENKRKRLEKRLEKARAKDIFVDDITSEIFDTNLVQKYLRIQEEDKKYWDRIRQAIANGKKVKSLLTIKETSDDEDDELSSGKTAFYAASICRMLDIDGFQDWFLPSRDELSLMYEVLPNYGYKPFHDGIHWSSTEVSEDKAFYQLFFRGEKSQLSRGLSAYILPIRAF